MEYVEPRIICKNGVSLSVQANDCVSCKPRINSISKWQDYELVEVSFIRDVNGSPISPLSWDIYSEDWLPYYIYKYIPVKLVEDFINSNGGEVNI